MTVNSALFRDIVRAFALGNADEAARLDAQIPQEDRQGYNIFVTAMFFASIGHRFEEDSSHEAIQRFVAEMQQEFRNAQPPLKPLVIEGMIRAAFGEEHFLDEISPDDQLMFQFPIIHKIVADSDHMRINLEDYLADAETLAHEWTNEN